MDRRSPDSLRRDYAIPMQDPNAFSLQYYKDTTRDPRKGLLKKKGKAKTFDLTDHTGLLKKPTRMKDQASILQDGGKFTSLDTDQEKTFQSWYKRTAAELGLNPDPDDPSQRYDYRGYYKEFGYTPMTKGQHFTDTYKLPGHETFSNESKYANFFNRDITGHWGSAVESGIGIDNWIAPGKSKLPIKSNGGALLGIKGMGQMQYTSPKPIKKTKKK